MLRKGIRENDWITNHWITSQTTELQVKPRNCKWLNYKRLNYKRLNYRRLTCKTRNSNIDWTGWRWFMTLNIEFHRRLKFVYMDRAAQCSQVSKMPATCRTIAGLLHVCCMQLFSHYVSYAIFYAPYMTPLIPKFPPQDPLISPLN
jgi:hypothetical protein